MGELRGKKGLFPTSHTEQIHRAPSPPKLQLLPSWKLGSPTSGQASDEEMSKTTLVNKEDSDAHSHLMTSDDDDHPFSDSASRSVITPSYPSSYAGHRPQDSATEDENENGYNSSPKNDSYGDIHSQSDPSHLVRQSSFGRKPPPPPPPRRHLASGLVPPPIPQRNRTTSSLSSLSTPSGSSPFDSPMRSTFSVNDFSPSANPFDKK